MGKLLVATEDVVVLGESKAGCKNDLLVLYTDLTLQEKGRIRESSLVTNNVAIRSSY
jgi:hypothetical protein